MRPNDETIYNGNSVENEENPQVENQNENEGKKAPWKMIGLGAATGILMGAGAIYATTAMAADGDNAQPSGQGGTGGHGSAANAASGSDDSLHVAHPTTGTSFSQAFAEARAEVGPGGVFHWNGGIYNTYTAEEWNAMSAEEKHEFAEAVKPEYSVNQVNTAHITAEHPRVHIVNHEEPAPADDPNINVNIDQVHIHYHEGEGGDDDVHVVGYVDSDIDMIGDDVVVVDKYVVDGHKAMVVNYVDEDKHDIAVVDSNDNEIIDNGEAMDMVTGDLLDSNLNPMNVSIDNVDPTLDASFDA